MRLNGGWWWWWCREGGGWLGSGGGGPHLNHLGSNVEMGHEEEEANPNLDWHHWTDLGLARIEKEPHLNRIQTLLV
ncbi:hypothetical protein HanRHA438_Chr09g0411391 [Helianthus annuus]|nr:hypothetical protein HanRHA438_Chr09g0411391 [Helianthus annuus]